MKRFYSEIKALGDSDIRSLAIKCLLLRIPLILFSIILVPIVIVEAIAYGVINTLEYIVDSKFAESPVKWAKNMQEDLYTRAADIKLERRTTYEDNVTIVK